MANRHPLAKVMHRRALTTREIAEATGRTQRSTHASLSRLASEGRAIRAGYRASPDGGRTSTLWKLINGGRAA